MQKINRRRGLTVASWILLIASPMVTIGVISLIIGKNAFAALPIWTDELDYWRSVYSWIHYGMDAGYSGIGELIPDIGVLSVHGPGPILLYAWFARIFGWSYYAIIWANCLWAAAGAAVLLIMVRPKAKTALLLSLSMMLYAPYVLYCCASMTELANYGMMLAYAGVLYRLHQKNSLPVLLVSVLLVTFMSVYRIIYFVLYLPVAFVACGKKINWKLIVWSLVIVAAAYGINYGTRLITSPYESGFLYHFLRADLTEAVQMFYSHAVNNLHAYFVLEMANSAEVMQRWLYCIIAGLCLALSLFKRNKYRGLHALCFLLLLVPWLIVIAFYEAQDWADYRSLAPFLWLAAAGLILMQERVVKTVFLAGCTVILVLLLIGEPQGVFADEDRFEAPVFSEKLQTLCEAISYDPDAEDPFDNTVRTEMMNIQIMSQLDPGLGVQSGIMYNDNTGKSRWILTKHLRITVPDFESVVENSEGYVYRSSDVTEE